VDTFHHELEDDVLATHADAGLMTFSTQPYLFLS